MRIAVFSDIHGNLHALQAVLEDIDRVRPDAIYCLGDLVGYGAYPNEVIEQVLLRGIPTVMGNYDQGVGLDHDDCGCAYRTDEARALGNESLRWTRARVTAENKARLRALLPSLRLTWGERSALLVHGSPRKINEYVYADRPEASLERIAASASANVLVFGHTHQPWSRVVGSVFMLNDGSVGKPKDGDPRAAWALLQVGEETQVSIRRVRYDVQAAADAVRASGLPATYADLLLTARG
ncbi:MAG: metallophosphoesterase family protein [Chloroflexi bacterium]|nr:metallophosphoesterase family protein [Chloroflexota bacterium]